MSNFPAGHGALVCGIRASKARFSAPRLFGLLLASAFALLAGAPSALAGPSGSISVAKTQRVAVKVNHNDQITVVKQDQFVSLPANTVQTVVATCPSGYVVTDGGPLVQQLDQGFGTPADIQVLKVQSYDRDSYTFVLKNPTNGNAQGHVFVTCVLATTSGGNKLDTDDQVNKTVLFPVGTSSFTVGCPAGDTAVAPGYSLPFGQAVVTGSAPSADLNSWTFTVNSSDAGSATFSIRCMPNRLSHSAYLSTRYITAQATIPAGQTQTVSLTCPVGYKGITAAYSIPDGVSLLGDEPQPITRVFTFENTSSSAQTVTVGLVCLLDTTVASAPCAFSTKTVTAHKGQTIDYQITVKNTGTTTVTLDRLKDPICDSGTVAGGAATLAPGQSTTYTCSHKVTSGDKSAGKVVNVARVDYTSPGQKQTCGTSNSVTVTIK